MDYRIHHQAVSGGQVVRRVFAFDDAVGPDVQSTKWIKLSLHGHLTMPEVMIGVLWSSLHGAIQAMDTNWNMADIELEVGVPPLAVDHDVVLGVKAVTAVVSPVSDTAAFAALDQTVLSTVAQWSGVEFARPALLGR